MRLREVGEALPDRAPKSRSPIIEKLQSKPGTWFAAPLQTTNYSNAAYRRRGIVQEVRDGVRYIKYEPPATRMEDETCNLTSPPQSGSPTS